MWRLLSKSLATGSNLKRRHIINDDQCRRCYSAIETEDHIFFECPYAKQIWRASGVSNITINSSVSTIEQKIEACLQVSSSARLKHMEDLPFWLLWRLWKSRNTLIFQQKEIHWRRLLRFAKEDAQEWRQMEGNLISDPLRRQSQTTTSQSYWQRPASGWIKCNTDGGFNYQNHLTMAGWVLRDENGVYKGSVQAKGRWRHDALESEFQAILMALQHCWVSGHQRIILENDSQKAMDTTITDSILLIIIRKGKFCNGLVSFKMSSSDELLEMRTR